MVRTAVWPGDIVSALDMKKARNIRSDGRASWSETGRSAGSVEVPHVPNQVALVASAGVAMQHTLLDAASNNNGVGYQST